MDYLLVYLLVELVPAFPLFFATVFYLFVGFVSTLVIADWAKQKDSVALWRSKWFRPFVLFGWIIFWPCYAFYRLVVDVILDGTS